VSRLRGSDGGYEGLLPPYIVLTEPQGRFDEAGFLGARYRPFATGGDPAQATFQVEGVVAPGIGPARQRSRRELLRDLDVLRRVLPDDPALRAFTAAEERAYEMILGDGAKAFDTSEEAAELRDSYGRSRFGQSCLVARRLVERGVPWVTINDGGWDTHKDNFPAMRRKLPDLDRGLATLLRDLSDRGLLARTVVWSGGEFGRTPRVDWGAPWNGGRGHWGRAFTHLLAGGGFRGGQVVGATDARGEEVKDRPVEPRELLAALYATLGIDADARLPHPEGLDARVLPEAARGAARAAPLPEIL
jgi:uncharacterized protein (DUF1501 family)